MKLSIIIPVYNEKDTIKKVIKIVGEVKVLLVKVWVSVVPTMVPDGKVTLILEVAIAAVAEILALVILPL